MLRIRTAPAVRRSECVPKAKPKTFFITNTTDEALRAAQLELLRGPIQVPGEDGEEAEIDASAPYYWAGFQIYGDWQ